MIRFYALPLSGYCTKVRIVLRIKQIPYEESEPHGGHYSSDRFRQQMPPGSIPAIQDGELKLFDSEAIIEYLEDVYPEIPMRAIDPARRAKQRALAHFHNTKLEPSVRTLFPIIKTPAKDREQGIIECAVDAFRDAVDRLQNIIDPRPFIGGSRPCLADCGYPATLRMGQDIFSTLGVSVKIPEEIADWMAALESHGVIGDEVRKNRSAVADWMDQFT